MIFGHRNDLDSRLARAGPHADLHIPGAVRSSERAGMRQGRIAAAGRCKLRALQPCQAARFAVVFFQQVKDLSANVPIPVCEAG